MLRFVTAHVYETIGMTGDEKFISVEPGIQDSDRMNASQYAQHYQT
jgi:hypothetical protein